MIFSLEKNMSENRKEIDLVNMDWFEVTKFALDNLINDDCICDYSNGEQRSKQDPLKHCRPTVYLREFYNIYSLFLIEHSSLWFLLSGGYSGGLCLTSV